MKKLAMALLLFAVMQPSAQTMVIHRSGQPDVRVAVADIRKITFTLDSSIAGAARPIAIKKIKAVLANILPNPFGTKIEYNLEKPSQVSIRVYNLQGKVVRTLAHERMNAGQYSISWNSCDETGALVCNGSYIAQVAIDGQAVSKKLFIVN